MTLRTHPVHEAAVYAGVNVTLTQQRGKGWEKVTDEGRCRMCLRPSSVRALTRHHVVPEGYFRRREPLKPLRNCDANLVPLCRPCHDLVDGPSPERWRHRAELRRALTTYEVAFALQLRGPHWFDHHYPRTTRPHQPQAAVGHAAENAAQARPRRREQREVPEAELHSPAIFTAPPPPPRAPRPRG